MRIRLLPCRLQKHMAASRAQSLGCHQQRQPNTLVPHHHTPSWLPAPQSSSCLHRRQPPRCDAASRRSVLILTTSRCTGTHSRHPGLFIVARHCTSGEQTHTPQAMSSLPASAFPRHNALPRHSRPHPRCCRDISQVWRMPVSPWSCSSLSTAHHLAPKERDLEAPRRASTCTAPSAC